MKDISISIFIRSYSKKRLNQTGRYMEICCNIFFLGRQVFTEDQFFNFSLHDNAYRMVINTY